MRILKVFLSAVPNLSVDKDAIFYIAFIINLASILSYDLHYSHCIIVLSFGLLQ